MIALFRKSIFGGHAYIPQFGDKEVEHLAEALKTNMVMFVFVRHA